MSATVSMEDWNDEKYTGLIGDKEIEVVSTMTESGKGDNARVVLFHYKDQPDKPNVYALRWSVGAIMDMHTDDVKLAKGSMNTMLMMEASDDD